MNTKNKTTAELLFIRQDLSQVIAAQEKIVRLFGDNAAPKLGQYNDELFVIASELKRRQEVR